MIITYHAKRGSEDELARVIGSIPDFAPPAIQKLWDQMNALVESRDGKPGLDFTHVEVISGRVKTSR